VIYWIKSIARGWLWCLSLSLVSGNAAAQSRARPSNYYISPGGQDTNPGSRSKPWQSLQPLGNHLWLPGDSVLLQGGARFPGSILLTRLARGAKNRPIVICSYGQGRALIDAQDSTAIVVQQGQFIYLENLILLGSGRKSGNTGRGIWLQGASHIWLQQIDASGFQKAGVELTDCRFVTLMGIFGHDNGYAGISVDGSHFPHYSNDRIYIKDCQAVNNPGDPTELHNHSGNGIVVGLATHVVVEYCVATGNGWDMPRKGNGPVGIWAWQCDSVLIQHCISYRNRTAPGAMDGGGFDLDGGATHCIVQYNLSYENEGYGFGIFQFSGATPWHHNTFRYNISFNDGNTAPNGASVLWWNGSKDPSQFHDCYFYNNLLYNQNGYALGLIQDARDNLGFFFLNNIFVAKDELMTGGNIREEVFYGNDWWSLAGGFLLNGFHSFGDWVARTGKEKRNGDILGHNRDPALRNPGEPTLTNPYQLYTLVGFKLKADSPLRNTGLDLRRLLSLHGRLLDFFGQRVPLGPNSEPGISELP
jgi:Right handed beta helix region